ncbi:MAG: choice-of-anchor J domain-containing protein [Flavobacteriales bacterium]
MKILFTFALLLSWTSNFAQTVILSTDFQQGMPVNYSIVNNDGNTPDPMVAEYTSAWITVVDPENTLDTVAASTSFFTSLDSASRWMITPPLSLGAFGNYIQWNAKSHDPSFPDNYLVLVSATDNQLASFTDTIGFIEEENFEWTNREVNLFTQGYHDQTIYIAFVNVTLDGFKLYIDDIQVRKEDATGITEPKPLDRFELFPNPSTDIVNISSPFETEKIEILDLNGTVLQLVQTNVINVQTLPNGIYFIRCTTDGVISSKRFTKI